MILNVKYADIANKFEAFMLLGLEGQTDGILLNKTSLTLKFTGAAHKHMNSIMELKKSTSKLIHEKLSE